MGACKWLSELCVTTKHGPSEAWEMEKLDEDRRHCGDGDKWTDPTESPHLRTCGLFAAQGLPAKEMSGSCKASQSLTCHSLSPGTGLSPLEDGASFSSLREVVHACLQWPSVGQMVRGSWRLWYRFRCAHEAMEGSGPYLSLLFPPPPFPGPMYEAAGNSSLYPHHPAPSSCPSILP